MSRDNRPPYFRFFPADFMADAKVQVMSAEEVGCYMRLLCVAWEEDIVGSVPDDDGFLSAITRVSLQRWKKIKAKVMAPWTLKEDGRWYQGRMVKEYEKAKAQATGKSAVARDNANRRWQSHRTNVPPQPKPDATAPPDGCNGNAAASDLQCNGNATAMPKDAISYSYSSSGNPLPPLQGGIEQPETPPRRMRASEIRQAEYEASLRAYADAESRKPVNHP